MLVILVYYYFSYNIYFHGCWDWIRFVSIFAELYILLFTEFKKISNYENSTKCNIMLERNLFITRIFYLYRQTYYALTLEAIN